MQAAAKEGGGRGAGAGRARGRGRTGMLDGVLLLLACGEAGEQLALPPSEDGLLHRRLVRHLDVRDELRCLLLRLLLLPGP